MAAARWMGVMTKLRVLVAVAVVILMSLALSGCGEAGPAQNFAAVRKALEGEGRLHADRVLEKFDTNGDRSVSPDDRVPAVVWAEIQAADENADDKVSKGELDRFFGHRYGPWSLVPAVLALSLAYLTRQVVLALFAGIVSGSVVVFGHSGAVSDLNFLNHFFIPAMGSERYAKILLVYLWFLGGILGVWGKTGGARHFAEQVGARLARSPLGAKLFAWIVGCVFHQGGTVSTVLAGTTVKPVADRQRVSHEELAYIVDSTASPVATILPFNAWPLFVGGLVAGVSLQGFTLIPETADGQRWFIESIWFNFYGWFAVLSTLLFSLNVLPWKGKVMRAAIQRARETGKLDADSAEPLLDIREEGDGHPGYPVSLVDFFVPLFALLGVAITPFIWPLVFVPAGEEPKLGDLWIGEAFLFATVSAMLIAYAKGMPLKTVMAGFVDGCKSMTLGAIILGMAVTLGNVSGELDTAGYLILTVGRAIPAWSLPLILTLLCMLISFSIGSSFGTYAVIFPLAVPLALQVATVSQGLNVEQLAALAGTHPAEWAAITFYVHVCFGAVMGGAVFGDQCSPISDTTILSSMFTGCDLMDHVRTQLPLALAAAALGIVGSTAMVLFFF